MDEKLPEFPQYDPSQAKLQVSDALIKASVIKVDDPETHYQARDIRRMVKLLDAQAERHYKRVKDPLNKAIKEIRDLEKSDREPMRQVMELLDPRIIAYEDNEQSLREQLQSKLSHEAEALAKETRERQVEELRTAGETERAAELEKTPIFIPPVIVPDSRDFLQGEGRMEIWEVIEDEIDLKTLCRAVLEDRLPESVIEPNVKALNGMARALKESFQIPGVKARRRHVIIQR